MGISVSKGRTRSVLWIFLFGAGISSCAFGQFSSLSTPADGSSVFFATELREKNTAEPAYGKVFQSDSSGLHLLYSRDIANQDKPCSNAYNLTALRISSVGAVLAVVGQCSCLNGNTFDVYNCVKIDRYTTTIVTGGQSRDYPGELWLSRNGKLALNRYGANIEYSPYAGYVIDLGTGQTLASYGNVGGSSNPFILLDSTASAAGRVVADNGTAVLTGGGLLILAGGTIQQISPPSGSVHFADATIDASGQTILATAHDSVTNQNSLRIATPGVAATSLFVADGYFPSMTDDGRQVLYLSDRTGTPQAWLTGIDGNGNRALTSEPDGLAEAILSGDGTIAYALTLGGRLLRIAVNSGQVRELIPRTPFLNLAFPSPTLYLLPFQPGLAPGKRVVLTGGGLSSGSFSAVPPLPQSLGGVSVSIQGRPAPILNVDPAAIDLLVPADATTGDNGDYQAPLHVVASSPSPFEARFDLTTAVLTGAPEAVSTLHEDWSAPVTIDHPAHPGEILHTYAFGLGPTNPAVPFGEATPLTGPLARISPQPDCVDVSDISSPSNGKSPVELSFAGLAPGMVAVYQVDWRVPLSAAGSFGVICPTSSGFTWGVRVPLATGY